MAININTVYKCQLKAVWFTRTIYCDKYLYAMHQKLHIIGTNEDFDKIIPLGERLEEVQRLARLAKQIKLIEVFIQWKQYNPKEPFFVRNSDGSFCLHKVRAFPIEVTWNDDLKQFEPIKWDSKGVGDKVNYMFESGRFVKAVYKDGEYCLPDDISTIQSFETEIINVKGIKVFNNIK
ncbi:MAG: hypothetical protein IKK07_07095 [Bacteroides sp.]|nr:hypothetical protein [Bacteroides sp.]